MKRFLNKCSEFCTVSVFRIVLSLLKITQENPTACPRRGQSLEKEWPGQSPNPRATSLEVVYLSQRVGSAAWGLCSPVCESTLQVSKTQPPTGPGPVHSRDPEPGLRGRGLSLMVPLPSHLHTPLHANTSGMCWRHRCAITVAPRPQEGTGACQPWKGTPRNRARTGRAGLFQGCRADSSFWRQLRWLGQHNAVFHRCQEQPGLSRPPASFGALDAAGSSWAPAWRRGSRTHSPFSLSPFSTPTPFQIPLWVGPHICVGATRLDHESRLG